MTNRPIMLCLMLACACAGGCAARPASTADEGNYRTIRAEPLRDTEAAKEANRRGLRRLDSGELDKAQAAFEQALTADVKFGPAHNNLGKVYFARKNWYKAAWEFENARKLMPRHPGPRNNLALVLERAGELDRAVDLYREAVGLAPDHIAYRANLTRALLKRGDRTKEVHTNLKRILEEDTRTQWLIWAKQRLARIADRFE
mgnify:CR=1 FL=1